MRKLAKHTVDIINRMKAAFAGDDVQQKNVELSRGAHEIERLALALAEANANHEKFERQYYLVSEKLEDLQAAAKQAADIIDANLHHQREKVKDAASVLREALTDA